MFKNLSREPLLSEVRIVVAYRLTGNWRDLRELLEFSCSLSQAGFSEHECVPFVKIHWTVQLGFLYLSVTS